MPDLSFEALIEKYLANSLSEAERAAFEAKLHEPECREALQQMIDRHLAERAFEDAEDLQVRDRIFEKLITGVRELPGAKLKRMTWWRVAAAACILLAAGAGAYRYFHRAGTQPLAVNHSIDISPGGNKATLTLSNGRTIILDSAHTGQLAKQGGSNVLKVNSGLLAYSQSSRVGNRQQAAVQYNTLTTPRGGQYQLVLPDGSKVWLNAASSIRYPTAFTGKERAVEITGEAYFEVAKNALKPFKVKVGGINIEVLGTHFNIMAYDDEAEIQTTLLKGSVKITNRDAEILLRPGQQAQINKKGKIKLIPIVDTEEAVAWKNNLFWFNNEDIQSVMRKISRWYNVDVSIEGNISKHFSGTLPRNIKVSKIFEVLEQTGGIHFQIKSQKIIVSP